LNFWLSSYKKWIFDNTIELKQGARAKFYVAITRAKYSVGIVCDYPNKFAEIEGMQRWDV